jgi:GT2 family glycosyltransferase
MLVRRAAHQRIGAFDERWQIAQDMDWYMRAMEAGLRLRVLPELVLRRRLHASSKGTTHRVHARQRLEILKAAIDRRRDGA